MDNPITVYQDRRSEPLVDFKRHTDNIEFLKQLIGEDKLTLEANGRLLVRDYVGFFTKNHTHLQILPKIYLGHDQTEAAEQSMKFLFQLLRVSGYFGFKTLEDTATHADVSNLLEIFIHIFSSKLLTKLKSQYFKQYIPRVETLPFIKGKILFQASFTQNAFQKHLHVIQYDDFSLNNPLNQLFKTTVKNLLLHSHHKENLKRLRHCLSSMEGIDLIPITRTLLDAISFNRLNEEYETLYNLAKLFYTHLQPGFSHGTEKTFSFLVPLHPLYEAYLYPILKQLENTMVKVICQASKTIATSSTYSDRFKIRPDFIIKVNDTPKIILDAKFKNPFSEQNKTLNILPADKYQLITYATAYHCETVCLIYPKFIKAKATDTEPSHETEAVKVLDSYCIKTASQLIKIHILEFDITNKSLATTVPTALTALLTPYSEVSGHKLSRA